VPADGEELERANDEPRAGDIPQPEEHDGIYDDLYTFVLSVQKGGEVQMVVNTRRKVQKTGREFRNGDGHDGMDAASISHLVVRGRDGAVMASWDDGWAPRI